MRLLLIILAFIITSSSCKSTVVFLDKVNSDKIDIASNSDTKFEFLTSMTLSKNTAFTYSEILTAAKTQYGIQVTITNIRFMKYKGIREVIFDVYQPIK